MIKLLQISAILAFCGTAQLVSASGGWYLLLPPTSYDEHATYLDKYKILDTKPVSQWSQQGAYDSASECEAAKNTLLVFDQNSYSRANAEYISALGSKTDTVVLELMRFTTERYNANVNIWLASRCTKSDDPRLAK